MDEKEKRRFDAVMQLHNSSWKRVTERRHYEWRIAFTLWTAFAAFIAIVVTRALQIPTGHLFWGVIALGLVLCIIHGFWLKGLGKAIDTDREMAVHYVKILRNLSNSNFDKEFEDRLNKQKIQRGLFGDWSRRCQLAVTVVLCVALILAVLAVGN